MILGIVLLFILAVVIVGLIVSLFFDRDDPEPYVQPWHVRIIKKVPYDQEEES